MLNFQVFMHVWNFIGAMRIRHPKSGLFPLLVLILNMNAFRKHATFFVFPLASWKFIRTEQKPIECKFLALHKTENRTSERKEKEKNKRKKSNGCCLSFYNYWLLSWVVYERQKQNWSREEVYFGSNVSVLTLV